MNSKQTVQEDIVKYVEEACKKIDKSGPISQKFLEAFKANLEIAINEAYFGEKKDDVKEGEEPVSDLISKEKVDYENIICSVISKRTTATKLCREVTEKNLAIEKKIMETIEVAGGVVVSSGPPHRSLPPKTREECRSGARKTLEHLKESTKLVDHLDDKVQELTKAAIVWKDCNESDFIR